MLYFIVQTILLALFMFIAGLFVGIFLKNILCKQGLETSALRYKLKRKASYFSSRSTQCERVNGRSSNYPVKSSESAAIGKKRIMALLQADRV